MDFYLVAAAIVVERQVGRRAGNGRGSALTLIPYLLYLDLLLSHMNLQIRLLLASLAEWGAQVHQWVYVRYDFGKQDLLSCLSWALRTPLSLSGDRNPELHLG